MVFGEIGDWFVEGLVKGEDELEPCEASTWELDGLGANGVKLAVLLEDWIAGAVDAEDEVKSLVCTGVVDVVSLASDKDELAVVAVEREISADVVDLSSVEEDPVTATETELDERVTVSDEYEDGTNECAGVGVDVGVVDAVGVEDDVKDWLIEEVDNDVLAASEVGVETELGVSIEPDVGEVEVGKVEAGDAVELACSLAVDETAFPNTAGAKVELDVVEAVEDDGTVEDASAVEDVNSHEGVTGITVTPPSSPSSLPSFRIVSSVSTTAEAVDNPVLVASGAPGDAGSCPGASERAIGPAEHEQAKAKMAAKWVSSILIDESEYDQIKRASRRREGNQLSSRVGRPETEKESENDQRRYRRKE